MAGLTCSAVGDGSAGAICSLDSKLPSNCVAPLTCDAGTATCVLPKGKCQTDNDCQQNGKYMGLTCPTDTHVCTCTVLGDLCADNEVCAGGGASTCPANWPPAFPPAQQPAAGSETCKKYLGDCSLDPTDFPNLNTTCIATQAGNKQFVVGLTNAANGPAVQCKDAPLWLDPMAGNYSKICTYTLP